ncbi:MAG: pantetheine-phosphate adenylyltransferase [Ruminococcaceae bacterium]|nr:pantetheine-phosphate adenylyltransferase [Oscillospiraceae bacterium]
MKVILPGSYDPITLGHLELIKRASSLYDEVFVTIFINPEKNYRFSLADRVKMISLATEELPNVVVDSSDGYVVDYMREKGIDKIIKGYRNAVDLEYERRQASFNLERGGYETELWRADDAFKDVSSTKARGYIASGENLEEILPEKVISFLNNH